MECVCERERGGRRDVFLYDEILNVKGKVGVGGSVAVGERKPK